MLSLSVLSLQLLLTATPDNNTLNNNIRNIYRINKYHKETISVNNPHIFIFIVIKNLIHIHIMIFVITHIHVHHLRDRMPV